MGKATPILLGMLEERDARLRTLRAGRETPSRDDLQARVERVLAELPERVQRYLEGLEKLLAQGQVERGKDILAALGTEILINPDGTAEIRGDLRKTLALVGARRRGEYSSVAGAEGFFGTTLAYRLSVRVPVGEARSVWTTISSA